MSTNAWHSRNSSPNHLLRVGEMPESHVGSGSSRGRTSSSSSAAITFGQPRTVETGTEETPDSQVFLDCATQYLQATLRHSGTADMIQKLQGGIALGDDAVIVGHGAPGILCTGNADHCSDAQDMLAISTASTWQPLLGQIKGKFKSITLIGCEVGEGALGANFLSALANATNTSVRTPNDIVSCESSGFTILNGGTWVQVDPSSTPMITRSPKTTGKTPELFKFKVQSDFVSVPLSNLKIISFQHRAYQQKEYRSVPPLPARSLLPLIDLANPIEIKGSIGSIATGGLTLEVSINDRPMQRHFTLLNDEMFEDRENPHVYYKTTSDFATALNSLLR